MPIPAGGKGPRRPAAILECDGLSFAVHRSGRRDTLQITAERSGDLSIKAPERTKEATFLAFVQEKLLWIHTKIEEKARLRRKAPVKEFVDGEGFLHLGESYRLRLVDEQFADLALTSGRLLLRRNRLSRARVTFIAWYTRNAHRWFSDRVKELARRMDFQVGEVKIKDLGFGWGAFSSNHTVQFHRTAILLLPRIAKCVIVDELAHANHPDHFSAFWHQIEQHMPDWQNRKTLLAEHGIEGEGL